MVTINARGIADKSKRIEVFSYYRFNADFLCIQETHSTNDKDVENMWRNEWGGGAIFSHGTSASRGVAVFYRKEFKSSIKNIECDSRWEEHIV